MQIEMTASSIHNVPSNKVNDGAMSFQHVICSSFSVCNLLHFKCVTTYVGHFSTFLTLVSCQMHVKSKLPLFIVEKKKKRKMIFYGFCFAT